MQTQGRDVVLQSRNCHIPPRCASCGSPPQASRQASKRKGLWGGGSVTRTFDIPYCSACADRARTAGIKSMVFTAATLGIAIFTSSVGFLLPTLPMVVLVGLPTVLALTFAVLSITVLAPKVPALPAMAAGNAVSLVSFSGDRSTLYCVNPQWGDEFARANNIQSTPKNRSLGSAFSKIATGLIGAPIAALAVWAVAHPVLHIDNAGPDALQIWVDGKPVVVAKPNPGNLSVWVPFGKRVLGYSKVGAAAPEQTLEAKMTMMDDHLYNPGKTACYWLIADSYGAASVDGIQQGPQSIKELYSFDKVNTWFGENPQSVEVQDGQGGQTRVALQRAKACMDLAQHGCDAPARDVYITCQKAAHSKADYEKCDDAVTCGDTRAPAAATATGKPAASGHGASPHGAPAGHVPPKASGATAPVVAAAAPSASAKKK